MVYYKSTILVSNSLNLQITILYLGFIFFFQFSGCQCYTHICCPQYKSAFSVKTLSYFLAEWLKMQWIMSSGSFPTGKRWPVSGDPELMWILLLLCGCRVINKTFREEPRWLAVRTSDNKQDTLLLSCVSKRVYRGLASTAPAFNVQGRIACPPACRWAFFIDSPQLCALVLVALYKLWCFITGQGRICVYMEITNYTEWRLFNSFNALVGLSCLFWHTCKHPIFNSFSRCALHWWVLLLTFRFQKRGKQMGVPYGHL